MGATSQALAQGDEREREGEESKRETDRDEVHHHGSPGMFAPRNGRCRHVCRPVGTHDVDPSPFRRRPGIGLTAQSREPPDAPGVGQSEQQPDCCSHRPARAPRVPAYPSSALQGIFTRAARRGCRMRRAHSCNLQAWAIARGGGGCRRRAGGCARSPGARASACAGRLPVARHARARGGRRRGGACGRG